METCVHCGSELKANAKFCSECGLAVERNATTQEYQVTADEVMKKVRELLHEGNVTSIVVKDPNGRAIFSIPATAGVVGVVIAPALAAVGAIAALMSNCTIVVVRRGEPASQAKRSS